MKKSRAALLLIGFLILSPSSARAQNAETQAQVTFVAGQGPTVPVDPDNPHAGSNEDGVTGSLAIVSVSDFQFGTISVQADAPFHGIQTVNPNIQVVDLRGTGAGWKVRASVSRFSDGTNASLLGAVININNGRPNSISTSAAPTQESNVSLTTDDVLHPVITAYEGAGIGLWVMRWYPDTAGVYIQLDVPVGMITLGNHSATINWVLEDTPS